MTNIRKAISRFGRACSDIRNLNAGGCGCWAAITARALQDAGIVAHGRIAERDADDFAYANSAANIVRGGIRADHVLVGFFDTDGGYYLADSRGIYSIDTGDVEPTTNSTIIDGTLSVTELEKLARTAWIWNDWFNRRSGIRKIRFRARKYLVPRINQKESNS